MNYYFANRFHSVCQNRKVIIMKVFLKEKLYIQNFIMKPREATEDPLQGKKGNVLSYYSNTYTGSGRYLKHNSVHYTLLLK